LPLDNRVWWARRLAGCLVLAFVAGCTASAGHVPRPSTPSRTGAPLPGVIAFVRATDSGPGHGQIYLQGAGGGQVRQLVRSDADDGDPVLAPDGRRVVFTRHLLGRPDALYVVQVDGSGLARLPASNCPAVCADAVEGAGWSPDGRRLAFTRSIYRAGARQPTNIEIWSMNADGTGAQRLTHQSLQPGQGRPAVQDNGASWSPDGSRLVFTRWVHRIGDGLDQFTVMTMASDGGDLRSVSPNDVNAGEPVWSPDGSLIAFQSPPDDEGVPKGIYTIRPDGTGMTSLTIELGDRDSDHPTWSPDSRWVAFSHLTSDSPTSADLYVVGRDGTDPRSIARTSASETAPSWGPAPA
jgi:TolB protein